MCSQPLLADYSASEEQVYLNAARALYKNGQISLLLAARVVGISLTRGFEAYRHGVLIRRIHQNMKHSTGLGGAPRAKRRTQSPVKARHHSHFLRLLHRCY